MDYSAPYPGGGTFGDNNNDMFESFNGDFSQHREAARKRFENFRLDAEKRRRNLFEQSSNGWPQDAFTFADRPFASAMVSARHVSIHCDCVLIPFEPRFGPA